MSSNKLDFLLRKNKGKDLLKDYKKMFLSAGFKDEELTYIELERSDNVIEQIKQSFPSINEEVEVLDGSISFAESRLLSSVFRPENDGRSCYMFSDDVYYCGMYLVKYRIAKEYCLNVAELGYSNTCFIVDADFNFSFTINYHGKEESEFQDMFNIQLKQRSNI